ncbi:polysaccharide biosynthesis family protein [Burkholderia cepacia]|nr:polysaccharide biosynthesis family protein [Burkholderia cepacia]
MSAAWLRLTLRVGALGLKFMLTIVVARTLGFDAVAAYGFALAVSVVASKVLGLGFSTEINRRLAGPDPHDAVRTCVRLSVLYAGVYALLCGVAALPIGTPGALRDVPFRSSRSWHAPSTRRSKSIRGCSRCIARAPRPGCCSSARVHGPASRSAR